mmetsp:Transcript_1444/g.6320  ORF Transcript_1444/g.6320 Transcript_1444/m.6320 type:complete len:202 (-) Transcript_1444:632-1237(-)
MDSRSTLLSRLSSSPPPSPPSPPLFAPFSSSVSSMRGSALNTPTILHSLLNPNLVCRSIRLPLDAIVPPHAAVLKCSESSGSVTSPLAIPDVLTSNFKASPSSRHSPARTVMGAKPPIARGVTTPFAPSSTAMGKMTRSPEAPHSGGIQDPRSLPTSSVSLHLVPTSSLAALPSKPRRLVTALPRVLARYALYAITAMTDH